MSSLLVLDVDNTILEKRKLDNIAYEKVSNDIFGRTISMLSHPVTGEQDRDFAKYTNHEIWEYKLKQILESREILKIGQLEINNINQIDISNLVSRLGEETIKHLETGKVSDFVNILINPSSLRYLAKEVFAVSIASSGPRRIQENLLERLGFYEVVDKGLCVFAEEGEDKGSLIYEATGKYFDKFSAIPRVTVYIGDSERDMKAIKYLNELSRLNYKGIGVLTGVSSRKDLENNGADLVVSNLKDKENLKKVRDYLRRLKNV